MLAYKISGGGFELAITAPDRTAAIQKAIDLLKPEFWSVGRKFVFIRAAGLWIKLEITEC